MDLLEAIRISLLTTEEIYFYNNDKIKKKKIKINERVDEKENHKHHEIIDKNIKEYIISVRNEIETNDYLIKLIKKKIDLLEITNNNNNKLLEKNKKLNDRYKKWE